MIRATLRLEAPGVLKVAEPASLPSKPAPDCVFLEVSHCALCRTDAKMWREGHRDLVLPRVLGHEVCGRLLDRDGLFTVWPGAACGRCDACRREEENLCRHMRILGFHRDGGLQPRVEVPIDSLLPVPNALISPVACLAEPLACTLNALEQARLEPELKVLIYGAGPVGLLMALAAQDAGACPVVVDISSEKRQKSRGFQAESGIDVVSALSGKTDFTDFDVAVNATPALQTLTDGLARLRPGGTFCLFSGFTASEALPSSFLNGIHYRQLHLVGAYGCTRKQMKEALSILCRRQKAARQLIEEMITPEEVPRSLEAILAGRSLKFIVQYAANPEI